MYINPLPWSYQAAFWGAGLSALAYLPQQGIPTEASTLIGNIPIIKGDVAEPLIPQVLLLELPEGRSIAVQGTVNTTQWLSYLVTAKMASVPGLPGRVFGPFALAADSVYQSIRPHLVDQAPNFLCGHSLGGAAAAIVAAMMVRDGWPVAGFMTFGAPKVGDATFRDNYPAHGWRAYSPVDIVPNMPPDSAAYLSNALGLGAFISRCYGVGQAVRLGTGLRVLTRAQIKAQSGDILGAVGGFAAGAHVISQYIEEVYSRLTPAALLSVAGMVETLQLAGYMQGQSAR